MTTALIIMLTVFILLLLLGLPIAFSVGLASFVDIIVKEFPLTLLPQRMFNGVDSFTLLAVPFFILAGEVMIRGGISRRLINLAKVLLYKSKCGLAYVTIIASAFFGAISGSASATAAAIGGMTYPSMMDDGYDPDYTAFLGAISGTLGLLIPPSTALLIFGTQTNTSVGSLFMVSAVAGVITTIVYCITAKITLRWYPRTINHEDIARSSKKEIIRILVDAFWGLLSPVIILGGIYSGVFTATEAAVISVVYSIFVGVFIYRELTIRKLYEGILESAKVTGMVLLLISTASLFSWLMTVEGVATAMGNLVMKIGLNSVSFFLIVNILYLILGMFVETIPIIILTAPIFFPISKMLGIDPVHFGVVSCLNLAFGVITPPFGLNLFVASGYSKRKVGPMVKAGRLFYVVGVALIFLFSYCPGLIMWINK